jgi:hypothetical protein
MSIHTTIESNIYNLSDLTQILDSQGIPWERTPVTFKGSNERAFCGVLARMNGESVLIYQDYPDSAFTFQSEGRVFRNRSSTAGIALDGMEQMTRKREKEEKHRQKVAHEQQKERQLGLHQEAAEVLQRLEAERAAKRQERIKPTFSEPSSSGSLDDVIGKFHQQNALRKIIESLETLDRNTGLSLYSQETLEDETIELTLRG